MTPKEKASALIGKILLADYTDMNINGAKSIALICVDEILNGSRLFYSEDYKYWQKVKQEIIKL